MSGATDVGHEAQRTADAASKLAEMALARANDVDERLRSYAIAHYEFVAQTRTVWDRLKWLLTGA